MRKIFKLMTVIISAGAVMLIYSLVRGEKEEISETRKRSSKTATAKQSSSKPDPKHRNVKSGSATSSKSTARAGNRESGKKLDDGGMRGNKKLPQPGYDKLTSAVLNSRQRKIMDLFEKYSEISMQEIREVDVDVSERTLRRDLSELSDLGLVVKQGRTKSAVYVLKFS